MPMFFHKKEEKPNPMHEYSDKHKRPQLLLELWAVVLFLSGSFGVVAPAMQMRIRGIVISESDGVSEEQKGWVAGVQQVQALYSILAGALHLVMAGGGVEEGLLKSVHHTSSMRTLLRADSIWVLLATVWCYVQLVPQVSECGWSTLPLMVEHGGLAVLGVISFVESRGERARYMGGLVQTEVNTASFELPALLPRTFAFYFMSLASLVVAAICLFLAKPLLELVGGSFFLEGTSNSLAKLIIEGIGMYQGLVSSTIVALLGSKVLAIEYAGTRVLWVWAGAMTAFFAMSMETSYLYGYGVGLARIHTVFFALLFGLSYHSMCAFARHALSASELVSGRG